MKPLAHVIPLLFASVVCLRANDTSLHDGRFGPEPLDAVTGKESPVRMVAEHLKFEFGYQYTKVHCTFTFRNTLDTGSVEQLVGFPDTEAAENEVKRLEPEHAETVGESPSVARLQNLKTWVDGRQVKSELKYNSVKVGEARKGDTTIWRWNKSDGGIRAWHTVRVSFPVGQDVTIEREYRVQNGAVAYGIAFFHYTTATGGVWKDTIGRMQADVTLRDGITADELIWPGAKRHGEVVPPQFTTSPKRAEWQVVDKTHLRLIWENFEPRTEVERRGFTLARNFHGW